jgi:hypothetical protein
MSHTARACLLRHYCWSFSASPSRKVPANVASLSETLAKRIWIPVRFLRSYAQCAG